MQRVLRSQELPAGTATEPVIRAVSVGGTDVLVCRMEDGGVVAFCATCPHQQTSLEQASFFEGRLRCARHLYLYDPHTGENIIPARDARPESLWKLKPGYLPVYEVEERDGWISVAPAPKPPPASFDPASEQRPTGPAAGTPAPAADDPAPVPPATTAGGTERLRMRVGQSTDLIIPVTLAPSHLWRLDLSGPALRVEGERFEPAPTPQHRFRLRADAAGEITVQAAYTLPWGGTPKETRTYVVTVEA
ncbi:MAG: Rieske 2Fe-2S domain-containing protein [Acidimicrobiales bacterium]